MKRIISFIMAIVLTVVMLTSCTLKHFSFDDNKEDINPSKLTVGQWLVLVNDAFGMESYNQSEPYLKNVSDSNPYFETVQIAVEWGVIDPQNALDLNEILLWETALVTLVNVGAFLAEDAKTEDKIKYALSNFECSIKISQLSEYIQYQDAVALLASAQGKWANRYYENSIEKIKYIDGLVNLVDSLKTDYVMNGNEVAIPNEMAEEISVGDIYILQSQENPLEYVYYKATQIIKTDEMTYLTNSEEDLELEDVVEELFLQGTIVPTAENTVIYDGNGNVISGPSVVKQVYTSDDPHVEFLGYAKTGAAVNHTFKVGEDEIVLSYNLNGTLDLKIAYKTDDILKEKEGPKIKGEASFEVTDLKITNDFDYSIWKGLKSATLKVDYNTKSEFSASTEKKIIDGVFAPDYSNGNGKFLTNFKRAILKDKDGRGAKTIASKKEVKICSLNVYNAGVAKVCLDVKLVISIDGSVSVTVTQGGTTGVEYKEGNIRFIKESRRDAETELKAQIRLTLGFGPGLYLIGLKKQLLGLEVNLGVGADAWLKMHLRDSEMHLIEELSFNDSTAEDCEIFGALTVKANAEDIQAIAQAQGGIYKAEFGEKVDLSIDTCVDVSVYGILDFGLADNAYVTKFLGSNVKLTCTVLSSKNAKFFNYHVDNFVWAEGITSFGSAANTSNCTLEYKPFDIASEDVVEPEATQMTENQEMPFGEFITLGDFRGEVEIGGKYCISIVQLPWGYSTKDLVYESATAEIAKVNSQGVVEGISSGNTTITVKTKDNKHVAVMAIVVIENKTLDFEGIAVHRNSNSAKKTTIA